MASGSARMFPLNPLDETIRIWDSETYEELNVLSGHKQGVMSLSWAPDNRRIASGSPDGTLRIWDAESGDMLRILHLGHSVWFVNWSPDGSKIAMNNGTILDAETLEELMRLPGDAASSRASSWSPDGRRIATAFGKEIKIWDVATGQEVMTLATTGRVGRVSWSPDGRKIASGSAGEGRARIWNAETGEEFKVEVHGGDFISWSRDSRKLASESLLGIEGYGIQVWDVEVGQRLLVLRGHQSTVRDVRWSPTENKVVSASDDFTVRVWGERPE